MTNNIFDDIRPFDDCEVEGVIAKLLEEPYFIKILGRLFPSIPTEQVVAKLRSFRSKKEFQSGIIIPFLRNLEKQTTCGVTASGIENLDPAKGYIFVSNHRDIILDSAFMNMMLDAQNFQTTEIGIGSNLLIYDWITNLVKLNKSFIVKRDLPVRQMMDASSHLSAYIRQSVAQNNKNVWIAQREGRAKDGNDKTQAAVLKMFNLSGSKSLIENFEELNIVPVAITYEYDPCDAQKAYQYQQKRDMPDYKKSKDEDLTHMNTGLFGRKGRVHFAFGTPINSQMAKLEGLNKNEQIAAICEMIDSQIYSNYHLWPNSFMALDKINGTKEHAAHYTAEQEADFDAYIDSKIAKIEGCDAEFVRHEMLKAYANPLINQLKAKE